MKGNGRFRPHLTGTAAILVALVVAAAAWFTVERIAANTRRDVGSALTIVQDTTVEALHLWTTEQTRDATEWADAPSTRALTEQLLRVERTRDTLQRVTAQTQLREIFALQMTLHGYLDFAIIAPDGTLIGAMHDAALGTPHALGTQEHALTRVLRGETVLTSPIPSHAHLHETGEAHANAGPAMFVLAPIRNATEAIVAVLSFHIDPMRDFTRIVALGRLGETGETYLFDRTGTLLSESRFESTLHGMGLMGLQDHAMLSVQIRDPGVDLRTKARPPLPREKWPLTRMAESAIRGEAGQDLNGYRDYRGVPVVGVWRWDAELGLGITTEQDEAEAYRPLRTTRLLVMVTVAFTAVLGFGLAGVQARERRRIAALSDQVRVSEENYRTLTTVAPVGIFRTDAAGRFTYVNDPGRRILGIGAEELPSTTWDRNLHAEDRGPFLAAWNRAATDRAPFFLECRFQSSTEEMTWALVRGQPESGEQGEFIGYAGSLTDITEMKRVQQELLEYHTRLEEKVDEALAEVKTLSGMLPICSSCKSIRDDKGYWGRIETYVVEHSEAKFSHSICPKCAKVQYPNDYRQMFPDLTEADFE